MPTQLKTTVFIIDEVHMLSKSAFNALLKTLEEPPTHVHFILATTELHKIPDTIVSRCQRFDFFQIPHDVMVRRLETLCQAEGIKVDKDVLDEVARRSGGSQRDAESLLDQLLTLGSEHITRDIASAVLPIIRIEQITDLLSAWAEGNLEKAVRTLQNTVDNGTEISRFQSTLVEIIRSVLLSRLGAPEVFLPYEAKQQNEIRSVLQEVSPENLRAMLNGVLDASRNMHDGIPQLSLELISVDLCQAIAAPIIAPSIAEVVQDGPGAKIATKEFEIKAEITSEDIRTESPVADGGDQNEGGLDLEFVKRRWSKFQKELRKKHASLPLALELAEPVSVDGKQVNIHVPFAFYAETVNSDQNNAFLGKLLSEVLEQPAFVRAEHKIKENNTVDALVNAFGGEVA
jgi:DNA polymerase III subunit gamma/tau